MTFISEMDASRDSLKKTSHTDGRLISPDASSVLALSAGAVEIYMSLPSAIINGVYSRCDSRKYFTDYLLFAVNPVDNFISPPGIYAALTPLGIEFTLWTLSGKVTILDTETTIDADTPFVASFCWDYSGILLGGSTKARMAIFVNEVVTSSTNSIISPDSISGYDLIFFDNESIDYGLECEIFDIITYSSIPYHLRYSIDELKYSDFGEDYIAMTFSDGVKVVSETTGDGYTLVRDIGTISVSHSSLAVSDSDMSLYVLSSDGLHGAASCVNSSTGEIISQLTGLSSPVCIGVTQLGGVDYPRTARRDPCRSVWICEQNTVILASPDLVEISRRSGYTDITSVIPTSDGRAWVLDRGSSSAVLLSPDVSEEEVSISVSSPEFGGVSAFNDLYVYDSGTEKIIKYTDGSKVNSAAVGPGVISMDVRPSDSYVIVALSDGSVRVYDAILKEKYSWIDDNIVSDVFFRRGYGRNTIYVVNDSVGKIIQRTIWGSFASQKNIGDGIFLGSSAIIANNNASIYSEIPVNASYDVSDGTITAVSISHYKVDTIPVNLTGGGDNDVHTINSGFDRIDAPLDINPRIRKGARTK